MKRTKWNQQLWRWSVLLLVLSAGVSTFASAHRPEAWARVQFAAAQRLQTALEGRPAQDLTRKDYERVIAAYKRIYLEAPTSTKADPSVSGVAQLLEEMGRRFNDLEVLHSAIQQYEFLRRQYPGSKARFAALYHIGEIYHDDLHDKARADEVFAEFLRRYPRNQFADEASKALAQPVEQATLKTSVKAQIPSSREAKDTEDPDADSSSAENAADNTRPAEEKKANRITRVTGLRYWTGPDFSRVAVDLDRSVKFESQRIDNPDRIFFDLLSTHLDSRLTGQTINVDDGLLKNIRIAQFRPGRTRVVLEVDNVADFKASLLDNPPRLVVDVRSKDPIKKPKESQTDRPAEVAAEKPVPRRALEATPEVAASSAAEDDGPPKPPVVVTTSKGVKKTIVEADDVAPDVAAAKTSPAKLDGPTPEVKPASKAEEPGLPRPARQRSKSKAKPSDNDVVAREAQPTENGDRSLIRALGLKIGKIVIDPGHGGHDTGTIGPNGLQEKDIVLDVSRRLGKLLSVRLGAEVIYTRSDDTFIPLETRTAMANQAGADLFVSVHANSSRDPDARGVETYYLNFSSSPDALEVAARENAVSEKTIHELQDLVKKIALKEKIEESQEFANDVERSLHSGLAAKNPGLRDRGVKKAPFIVLIGANMPSILAEISFLSNPTDERKLKTQDYRQRIAESLYRGIAKYVSGLSGVKVASKIEKGEGQ